MRKPELKSLIHEQEDLTCTLNWVTGSNIPLFLSGIVRDKLDIILYVYTFYMCCFEYTSA